MYLRDEFLGSGGYAICYKITTLDDFDVNQVKPSKKDYAIKIIEKSKLCDDRKKKKMEAEL